MFYKIFTYLFRYLSYNKLRAITKESFKKLWAARLLQLKNNNIQNIEEGSFDDLINLTELYVYGIWSYVSVLIVCKHVYVNNSRWNVKLLLVNLSYYWGYLDEDIWMSWSWQTSVSLESSIVIACFIIWI